MSSLMRNYANNYWNIVDWLYVITVGLFAWNYWDNMYNAYDTAPKASGDGQSMNIPGKGLYGEGGVSCEKRGLSHIHSNVYKHTTGSYTTELAVIFCLAVWRSLKYLQVSPAMLTPFAALERSVRDTAAFLVVFSIVNLGFAWIFSCLYR